MLTEKLKLLFELNCVYEISYWQNKLTIELRSDQIHQNIIEQLIAEELG